MTSHRILLSLIICLTLIACARPRVVVGSDAGMADASFPDGYTNDAIVTDASLDSSVSVDASVLQDAMPDVLDMSTTPTLVDSVECGAGHTCAILDDGTVACWGKNYNYQLGIGTRGVGIAVLSFDVAARAEQVAVGDTFTCALLDDGGVRCWGSNAAGQLGIGSVYSPSMYQAVDLGASRHATAITAGSSHVCALLDDHSVKCWGNNAFGQLGLGDTNARGDAPGEMGDALPIVQLGSGRHAMAIAAMKGVGGFDMSFSTCALLDDQTVKCWGENNRGQLGLGDTDARGDEPGEMGDSLPVVLLGSDRHAVQLAAGGSFACAILDDGTIKCWGFNRGGVLGLGDMDDRGDEPGEMGDALPAIDFGATSEVSFVVAGPHHACARFTDHALRCWGSNFTGQLGLEDNVDRGHVSRDLSSVIVNVGSARYPIAMCGGGSLYVVGGRTCAVLDNHRLKCWGDNYLGALALDLPSGEHLGDEAGEMGDALPYVELSSF